MSQIYKVFSNNLAFSLKEDSFYSVNKNCIIVHSLEEFINLMQLSVLNRRSFLLNKLDQDEVVFYSDKIHRDWNEIVKSCVLIKAAGGVVREENRGTLFIMKNGKWDLPKGKIDDGESPETAAIREINEECGLADLEIESFICKTYHLYQEESVILKETSWFLVKVNKINKMSPQKEEGITKLQWLTNKKSISTYTSIKHVIAKLND